MDSKIEVYPFSNSSNILRADFDHLTDVMVVYFKNGSIYQFVGVPFKIFEDFKTAESPGKYFLSSVKGKFDHLKRT